jgi:hypothetical protein
MYLEMGPHSPFADLLLDVSLPRCEATRCYRLAPRSELSPGFLFIVMFLEMIVQGDQYLQPTSP